MQGGQTGSGQREMRNICIFEKRVFCMGLAWLGGCVMQDGAWLTKMLAKGDEVDEECGGYIKVDISTSSPILLHERHKGYVGI